MALNREAGQTGQTVRVHNSVKLFMPDGCTVLFHKHNRVANSCELCAAAFIW